MSSTSTVNRLRYSNYCSTPEESLLYVEIDKAGYLRDLHGRCLQYVKRRLLVDYCNVYFTHRNIDHLYRVM